jgi:hypothetical protein
LSSPEDFETDLGAQLVAVAAAQVAPATEQAGTYLVELLRPVAAKLERSIEKPPAGIGRSASLIFTSPWLWQAARLANSGANASRS